MEVSPTEIKSALTAADGDADAASDLLEQVISSGGLAEPRTVKTMNGEMQQDEDEDDDT